MEIKEIYLQTENFKNIKPNQKQNFATTMSNLDYNFKKRKHSLNYSKLKFKQNVLVNILRKRNLKKCRNVRHTSSRIQFIPINTNILNNNYKLSYNLNKKYHDLPGISNFHNITDEKINDLISSKDNNTFKLLNSQKIINIKSNLHNKNHNNFINKDNNTQFLIKNFKNINNKAYNNRYQNNNNYVINKNKKMFKKLSVDSKKMKSNLNKININITNSLSYFKNKNEHMKINTSDNNNSLLKSKKGKSIIHTIASSAKKIKLSKGDKLSNNLEIKKWLESIQNSIDKYDYYNRGSKVDRLIFYMINPEECFEDNLIDIKSGDKYLLLKKQIARHKNKLESILKDIKLNQIKNEYLMKKYIFDLLSRRKKIY